MLKKQGLSKLNGQELEGSAIFLLVWRLLILFSNNTMEHDLIAATATTGFDVKLD